MNCYEIKDEICFKQYWNKHCPTAGREQARKMWHFSREVADVSTDMKINKKVPMYANVVEASWAQAQAIYFAPSTPQVACPKDCSVPCATKNKGNNPMYVENDKHIESAKINYITERAAMSYGKKRNDLFEVFHLDTPLVPLTPEALVEAITAGKYQIKPKGERNQYDRVTNQIIWRSADIKADQAGYDKAIEELGTFYQTVKDTVVIGTPAEAMEQIKLLDAWVPTTKAS